MKFVDLSKDNVQDLLAVVGITEDTARLMTGAYRKPCPQYVSTDRCVMVCAFRDVVREPRAIGNSMCPLLRVSYLLRGQPFTRTQLHADKIQQVMGEL